MESFSKSDVDSAWSTGQETMKELGLVGRMLEDNEIEVITDTLNNYFAIPFVERAEVMVPLFKRHLHEICIAASIAKEQMDAEVDGMFPASGKIGGPVPIRAAYFGVGKDWEDIGSITTGSVVNWIHSGTAFLGGTAGNPIRIGRNAVHVVFAIGNLHPNPKLESVKFELNGTEKPIIQGHWQKVGDLNLTELESAFIFKRGTTALATLYATDAVGASINDIPYLVGVSFILEDKLKLQDPTVIPGTVHDVVTTT